MKLVLVFLLTLSFTIAAHAEKNEEFPLHVTVTQVDMATGQNGISGVGNTDPNGGYHSRVSGGGTYTYHLFTVRIAGEHKEYVMTTPSVRKLFRRAYILPVGMVSDITLLHVACVRACQACPRVASFIPSE